MRRRTQYRMLVLPVLLGSFSLAAFSGLFESIAIAQAAAAAPPSPFKQKPITLKDKELTEKGIEKTKAIKPDRSDVAPIQQYYNGFLIPLLTQSSPESVNKARMDISNDIVTIETNKALSPKFNAVLIELLKELVMRGADGSVYSPQCRINAMVLLGKLNSEVTTTSSKPEANVQGILLRVLDEKGNDGLLSSALSILTRHLKYKGGAAKGPPVFAVSEKGSGLFVDKLKVFLTAPAPVYRDPDAHNYLKEQVIECLTLIADNDPNKEPSKLAAAALTPALVKILDEQESEWLVEKALWSFGTVKSHNLTPEDVLVVEKAIAKFTIQSLRDWKKRIANSGAIGGMGGGYPGGDMGGVSGMPGGMSGEGGDGGYGGMPGANRAVSPYAKQPKEVKNARRIAHQRFERIHVALNGVFYTLKPLTTESKEKAKAPSAEKGLLALLSENAKEKEKVIELLTAIEQFQADLNDFKVIDLSSLSTVVSKSIRGMREATEQILGDAIDEATKEPADGVFGSP